MCNSPGDHQSLLLSSGNSAGAFRNHCIHSHRHFPDILCNTRQFCCLPGILLCQPWRRDHNIGINIPLKKLTILHDYANLLPERFQINFIKIFSVIINGSLHRFLKSKEQTHKGGLPAASLAYNRHILSRVDFQRQVIQYKRHVFIVPERYMIQLDPA